MDSLVFVAGHTGWRVEDQVEVVGNSADLALVGHSQIGHLANNHLSCSAQQCRRPSLLSDLYFAMGAGHMLQLEMIGRIAHFVVDWLLDLVAYWLLQALDLRLFDGRDSQVVGYSAYLFSRCTFHHRQNSNGQQNGE